MCDIAELCYEIAGSKDAFRDRPFLSLSINHAVPPLRFSDDACDVLLAAAEQGMLIAASVRVAQYLDLPNPTIAGATDSKAVDAQSGFEKYISVSLAAQTGANMITQSCGMLSGLMACSHEAYVVDNDMLGVILRTLSPVEMSESALNLDAIESVVAGEGHFLGHPETYKRMQTDFLYPEISDRRAREDWEADGRPYPDTCQCACTRYS